MTNDDETLSILGMSFTRSEAKGLVDKYQRMLLGLVDARERAAIEQKMCLLTATLDGVRINSIEDSFAVLDAANETYHWM